MSKSIFGTTYSNFQYIPKIETDFPEKLGKLQENLLEFETEFKKGDFINKELEVIARNLESTAVFFGKQHGLEGSNLLIIGKDNLKADVEKNKINFYNKTRDKYGRLYAGFVEYGHYSGDTLINARPFMRPALYAVSKASTGDIANVLQELYSTIFLETDPSGYQGVHKLRFGKELNIPHKYKSPNNQVANALSSSRIKERYAQDEKTKRYHIIKGEDWNTLPSFQERTEEQYTPNRRNLSPRFKKEFSQLKRKQVINKKTKETKEEKIGKVGRKGQGKKGKGKTRRRRRNRKGTSKKQTASLKNLFS